MEVRKKFSRGIRKFEGFNFIKDKNESVSLLPK